MNWYHDDIFDNLGAFWTGSEVHVGNSKTEVVPAQTKFWSISGMASAYYVGSETQPETSWQASYTLINRTGNIFPDYTDSWSHKKASDGLRTDWNKVTNPVNWDNNTRGTAISQYINLYGNPKWDWSNYQIHHIQPRAYGGTNDISNLIPIPASQHSLITSWFNGY
jgi:hypothetical protein